MRYPLKSQCAISLIYLIVFNIEIRRHTVMYVCCVLTLATCHKIHIIQEEIIEYRLVHVRKRLTKEKCKHKRT